MFPSLRLVARIPAGDLPYDVPRPAPVRERHLRAVS